MIEVEVQISDRPNLRLNVLLEKHLEQ